MHCPRRHTKVLSGSLTQEPHHIIMCSNIDMFTILCQIEDPIEVTVGDGRTLTAVGKGNMVLSVVLPNDESIFCTLRDVLYVPKLTYYNLVSVAKMSKRGNIVKFTNKV